MKYAILILLAGSALICLSSCKGKGEVPVSEANAEENFVPNVGTHTYHVIPADSKVFWEGYRPALWIIQRGTVNVSEGTLTVKDGMIESGSFTIDMNSITTLDAQGQRSEYLEAHLKGALEGKEDDFFNVTKYPTARFTITKVTALDMDREADALITGDLTLKDITKEISFKAKTSFNSTSFTATTPLFRIDRTEWDVRAFSNKFFDNLREEFVNDMMGLRIELHAEAGKDL
jgi:polyisoprenoid-binding protein YceI